MCHEQVLRFGRNMEGRDDCMNNMNNTDEIYELCKNEDSKTNDKYPYIVKCINEPKKKINKKIYVENETEAFYIVQKRKLKEIRKVSYPFGWIPYVFNSSTINFQAKIFQDEQNTDYICFETKVEPLCSKNESLEILRKRFELAKVPTEKKIIGKIHWTNLAPFVLNINFDADGTIEIYQSTCCISYNPNRSDKLRIGGLYSYKEKENEYFIMWCHAVIDGHPRFIDCHIDEKTLIDGLEQIHERFENIPTIFKN